MFNDTTKIFLRWSTCPVNKVVDQLREYVPDILETSPKSIISKDIYLRICFSMKIIYPN